MMFSYIIWRPFLVTEIREYKGRNAAYDEGYFIKYF